MGRVNDQIIDDHFWADTCVRTRAPLWPVPHERTR